MKPEYRVLIFVLNLLIVVPALYALGDWLGGWRLAFALPTLATLATLFYAWRGEGPTLPPPTPPPTLPPGAQPS